MIDSDLLIIEEPDDQVVSVAEHLVRPDGSVRLVLLVSHVDDPAEMLAGISGRVTLSGDGALIAWEWPREMVPATRVETCTTLVQEALVLWAAGFLGEPIHLHRLS